MQGTKSRVISIKTAGKRTSKTINPTETNPESSMGIMRELNDALTNVNVGLSHDIKTLVNGVMCMTTLLEKTSLTIEQAEILNLLRSSAEELNVMMRGILEESELKTSHRKSVFNVKKLLEDIVGTFKLTHAQSKVNLQLRIDKSVPATIQSNRSALHRILNNLLHNAFKFTPSGDITVSVSSLNVLSDKVVLQFSITDTGIGIKTTHLDKIFQPFVRHNSNGFGIGLATVKELVEKEGGIIRVKSTEGVGSEFTFTLPIIAASLSESNKNTPLSKSSLKGISLLLVDDDVVHTKYLTTILKQNGAETTVAQSATAALALIEQHAYDLIITDLRLPDMDGYFLSYTIQHTHNKNRNKPILGMSAGRIDRAKWIFSGMAAILPKPLSTEGVLAHIQKTLNNDRNTVVINKEALFTFSPQLDAAHLQTLYGNDIEHAALMFDTFLTETMPQVEQLSLLAQNEAWQTLREKVHRLKPAFSMVGLTDIENLLADVEANIQYFKTENIFGIIREINTNLTQATPILHHELKRLQYSLRSVQAA